MAMKRKELIPGQLDQMTHRTVLLLTILLIEIVGWGVGKIKALT